MLGIRLAHNMKGRINQLRELERIINYLEGEIRYKHSLLGEACFNVAGKCGQPFQNWLESLSNGLISGGEGGEFFSEDYIQGDFCRIWSESLSILRDSSLLHISDLEEINNIGQALGQTDIETKKNSLMLEKDIIHQRIEALSADLSSKMRNTIILFFLGGLMTVIVLI